MVEATDLMDSLRDCRLLPEMLVVYDEAAGRESNSRASELLGMTVTGNVLVIRERSLVSSVRVLMRELSGERYKNGSPESTVDEVVL
jgi:hypothetical protein